MRGKFFFDTPFPRPVYGLRWAIFTERSGGVAAIVCDDTDTSARQGSCDRCLVIDWGGGTSVGSLSRRFSATPRLKNITYLLILAHRNRSDFCDLRLRCPSRTPEIARFPREETAMMHCDLRVPWKVASDLRFRAAISEPKTPSFCGIAGDLAPSTRRSLAIAIVRFWCAKLLINTLTFQKKVHLSHVVSLKSLSFPKILKSHHRFKVTKGNSCSLVSEGPVAVVMRVNPLRLRASPPIRKLRIIFPPPTRRRVKQVRFGKLAFLQLNGAFFEPRMLVFGHFALRFQRETGKLALWPGNRAYFCAFRGIRQIGLSCYKAQVFVLKTQKTPHRTKCANGPDQTFFIENVARNGLKSHFLGPKKCSILL